MVDIYKLDVLSATLALHGTWEELPSSVVKHCWEHTALCNRMQRHSEYFQSFDAPHRTDLESFINRMVRTHALIEISQVLYLEDKNDCIEVITGGSIMERVIISNDTSEVADADYEVNPLPSVQQQLAAVPIVLGEFDMYCLHCNLQAQLSPLQRSVCLARTNNETQTSLDQYFSKM